MTYVQLTDQADADIARIFLWLSERSLDGGVPLVRGLLGIDRTTEIISLVLRSCPRKR